MQIAKPGILNTGTHARRQGTAALAAEWLPPMNSASAQRRRGA